MDPKEKAEDMEAEDMSPSEVTAALKDITSQLAALTESVAEIAKPAEDEEEKKKAEDMEEKAEDEEEEKGKDACEEEGMDALTLENKKLKKQVSKLQTSMDSFEKDGMKNLLSQISKRDALASKLSDHVGTFDHSEMTLADVAKYGVDKLELDCDSGEEVSTLNGFLHQRKPDTQSHGMDSAGKIGAIDSYLKGDDK